MASIDSDRDDLVIRIVFDGSPLSGKTTTVRSLAASLGETSESPEEVLGRTIYFDWLEYTGGLWNGHRIRCQVLTVPGQRVLGARRFELLRMADTVVFVLDSARAQKRASLAALEELGCVLSTFSEPRPMVLVQLNKRDVPDAVPREEIEAILPEGFTDLAETVATDSSGIRDVFVRAVRLALQRAEKLKELGDLPYCRPTHGDSESLLQSLKGSEKAESDPGAPAVPLDIEAWDFLRALAEQPAPIFNGSSKAPALWTPAGEGKRAPLPPTADSPPGGVWPPARGRTHLRDLGQFQCLMGEHTGGDWEARFGSTWKGLSRAEHVFDDFDEGRKALLSLTQAAVAAGDWLSPEHCLVLSPTHASRWRLWEIIPSTVSVKDLLLRPHQSSPRLLTASLALIAQLLLFQEREWPAETLQCELRSSLVALRRRKLAFNGFLAEVRRDQAAPKTGSLRQEVRLLSSEFFRTQGIELAQGMALLGGLLDERAELAEAARSLTRLLSEPGDPDATGDEHPAAEASEPA